MEEYRLIFINRVGEDSNDNYQYEFMFSKDITLVWGDGWSTLPAGICIQRDKMPHTSTYDLVKKLTTSLNFDVAQDNTCFSMQDCIDGIIALGWENITEYDEYPDNRLIFHYGETLEDVIEKLNEQDIKFFN